MVPPWIRRWKWVYFYTKSTLSFLVLVVVVDILFCLMHLNFFINVQLHWSLIEMGSPTLSTKSCNPAPLPLPNNNTVIILGICIEFLYENILLHFPWKVIKTHFIHSWFICVHFSCLIRALLLKHGLLIKNILYRLSYSFSSLWSYLDFSYGRPYH